MNESESSLMSSNGKTCPQCGAALPAGVLAGLCPACLLRQGAATDTVDGLAATPFEPPPPAELARHFPQLEILELLGRGGMGAVYKARQKQLDRLVALKILPPAVGHQPAFAERFAREAKALARLNHPSIVTLYEFGQTERSGVPGDADAGAPGLFYFLMEFVDGVNLRQLLHAGRLAPREALAIVPQICDALQYAHDHGIVHRDIKPENILLDRQGRVKVADFGLAKLVGRDAGETLPGGPASPATPPTTEAGAIMGTPQYMAPEQREHPQEVDHRADIFSLGVVFYQMLTGELPTGRFEPPSKKVVIDVRLDEVVLHALEKNPERRYQQASQVKTDVQTITAATAHPTGSPAATNPWQPAILTLAILITAAMVAFGLSLPWPIGCVPLVVGVATGIIAVLKLAGLWPFPSPMFRESNFTSRNLPTSPWPSAVGPGAAQPRFSRTAIMGAGWAPLFFFVVVAWFTLSVRIAVPAGTRPPGPEGWQLLLRFSLLPLGLLAPAGTTLLGWIAVAQIRHSAGKLYGLWLAVFDGLVFPLLLLDAVIWWIWTLVIKMGMGSSLDTNRYLETWNSAIAPHLVNEWATAATLVTALVVDFLIIRAVWRAVNKPPGSAPMAVQNTGAPAKPPLIVPPAAEPRRKAPAALLVSLLVVHGLALVVVFGLTVLILPRFVALYQDFGAALPQVTLWAIALERVLANYWFLVLPALLALDAGVCFLLRQFGGRKALFGWAVVVLGALVVVAVSLGLALFLPIVSLEQRVSLPLAPTPLPAPALRSAAPEGAHISANNRSVLVVHDRVEAHYALYYQGDFTSSSQSSHNTRSLQWVDDTSVQLMGGRTFVLHRDSNSADALTVNGRVYNLRQGRVLVLQDDGTVEKLPLFPPLATARDVDALSRLVADHKIAQLKLQNAELEVQDSERKVAVGVLPSNELQKAKLLRDLAAAEVQDDKLESARLKLAVAELDLNVVTNQLALGLAKQKAYAEARLVRDTERIRYQQIQAASSQTPVPPALAPEVLPSGLEFGPIIHRVIQPLDSGTNLFLNLDTGRLLTPPKDIAALFQEPYGDRLSWELADDPRARLMREWLRTSGANLMVSDGPLAQAKLEMRLGVVAHLPWAGNERVTFDQTEANMVAGQAQSLLRPLLGNRMTPIRLFQPGLDPQTNTRQDTFLFLTDAGAIGVLQILDTTERPRGVRVRYRLVQSGTTK